MPGALGHKFFSPHVLIGWGQRAEIHQQWESSKSRIVHLFLTSPQPVAQPSLPSNRQLRSLLPTSPSLKHQQKAAAVSEPGETQTSEPARHQPSPSS